MISYGSNIETKNDIVKALDAIMDKSYSQYKQQNKAQIYYYILTRFKSRRDRKTTQRMRQTTVT